MNAVLFFSVVFPPLAVGLFIKWLIIFTCHHTITHHHSHHHTLHNHHHHTSHIITITIVTPSSRSLRRSRSLLQKMHLGLAQRGYRCQWSNNPASDPASDGVLGDSHGGHSVSSHWTSRCCETAFFINCVEIGEARGRGGCSRPGVQHRL